MPADKGCVCQILALKYTRGRRLEQDFTAHTKLPDLCLLKYTYVYTPNKMPIKEEGAKPGVLRQHAPC
jgi:hypothetical protein